jgi:hypothetical protein
MTVLEQYRRLESLGLWRDGPDDQRREVVVSLGEATLVVSTPAETALTHWSLPAIERLNPGRTPALYAPGAEAEERLEIDDPDMIAAIEAVRSPSTGRPHPGRLRWMIGAAAALAVLAGAVFWLPGALTRQTVTACCPRPSAWRSARRCLSEIGRLAGPPCDRAARARGAGAAVDARARHPCPARPADPGGHPRHDQPARFSSSWPARRWPRTTKAPMCWRATCWPRMCAATRGTRC